MSANTGVSYIFFNISATPAEVYSHQRLSPGQKGKKYAGYFGAIQTELKEQNLVDGSVATQCDLWLCIQTYKASIQGGILEVLTKSSWSTATP
jgi:hypothetical protein